MAAPTKVAVLGGGIGGLVAAYELSKTAALRRRYSVTVYQMGWRLGGKGASGRNLTPEGGDRVEEHGLHIWLGNYQNAFRLMKACYDHCNVQRLMPNSPFKRWQDAFKMHSELTLMEKDGGQWKPWQIQMPRMDGWPGEAEQCLSLEQLICRGVDLLNKVRQETPTRTPERAASPPIAHLDNARKICERMSDRASKGLPRDPNSQIALLRNLTEFRSGYKAGNQTRITASDVQRRRWILVDLATTLLMGILDDVLLKGHDSMSVIDDEDFRDWLTRHGADAASIDSAPVRNTYEIVFGYQGGDDTKPSFGAGTAVRFLLRWVGTYRGGFLYKMQAGMGDVVFSPLYLTLKDRGVKFKFFHRVQALQLDAAKQNVAKISMAEQVKLLVPEYNPLVEVDGIPSWPSAPVYTGQIDPADKLKVEQLQQAHPGLEPLESAYSPLQPRSVFDLNVGTDFDRIVLAIPLGALKEHCAELIAANPKFADMVANVQTVATQSFQLWLNKDAHQLGWQGSEPAILDSYLDSYADFSHLIPRENHPDGSVLNVGYFCKQLKDVVPIPPAGPNTQYEVDSHERVRQWSRDSFLNGADGLRTIWPNAYAPGGGDFSWEFLTDHRAPAGVGKNRFDAQYWCANVNPSDRYVQAIAGTTKFRLKANESGFQNVAMAGDWIKTGVDAGCIEGATLGGMQAARAISGFPKAIPGEHDFCEGALGGCLLTLFRVFRPVINFFKCIWKCARGSDPALAMRPLAALTSKPSYVERGGEQVFPPPYLFNDSVLHGFVVDAGLVELTALCNRHLNDPSLGGVQFLPALNRVLVARMDIGRAVPETPAKYDYGFIREIDVAFFIPVIRFENFLPVAVGVFAPYLFVDHPWGILCGREVEGLHKIPSVVSPMSFSSSELFNVRAHAAQTLGSTLEVPHRRVLSINTVSGAPVPAFANLAMTSSAFDLASEALSSIFSGFTWDESNAGAAWDMILASIFGPGFQIPVPGPVPLPPIPIQNLLGGGMLRMFSLKQFRDVVNGSFACYQAVNEIPTTPTGFTGASAIAEPLVLRIDDLVSHPLKADFGWGPGDIPITSAFQVQFGFKVDNGTILWSA